MLAPPFLRPCGVGCRNAFHHMAVIGECALVQGQLIRPRPADEFGDMAEENVIQHTDHQAEHGIAGALHQQFVQQCGGEAEFLEILQQATFQLHMRLQQFEVDIGVIAGKLADQRRLDDGAGFQNLRKRRTANLKQHAEAAGRRGILR